MGGTVWALMAGDYSVVPIRYGCGQSCNSWNSSCCIPPNCSHCSELNTYKIPADLYFADFNGDWNVDGNDYYGQPYLSSPPTGFGSDNPDYNPEIFVGRLLCINDEDILNWTEKLIRYEQYPGEGDFSYLNKSFMIVSDQMQQGNQAQYVANYLPNTFTHTIWGEIPGYNAPMPSFPSGSEVVTEMNNFYGLYSWFGHGSPIAIVTKSHLINNAPRYTVNTFDAINSNEPETGDALDNLTNEKFPAVLYSIGCSNTPFDIHDHCNWDPGRNLGEGFTVTTKVGGVAFLGNTRFGWVGSSYQLYKKLADLIRIASYDPESGKSHLHLGVAESISKQNYNNHYLRYSHNLVGCPETQIWINTPDLFTNVTLTDNGTSLTVNTGVSGCNINVRSVNNGLSYKFNADNVSSYTFNTSIRPLIITITNSQYLPYTAITGGILNIDAQLWGRLSVLGHLTVASGTTLTIEPGTILNLPANTSLRLPAGISLHIYGTLNAQGTSTNKILFDREGNSGRWGSIIFNNSSSSNSILDNTIIKNGIEIRCFNNANVTIQNSIIDECEQGVYIYNAAPKIKNNMITPYYHGIYGEGNGQSPLIQSNSIKRQSPYNYQGIYLLNFTNPFITGNDIQGFAYGIYYGGGGSGSLTDNYYNTPVKNNRLTNNIIGLCVAWGSYLIAGMEPLDKRSEYTGHKNSIWGNTNYDASAYQSGTIMAHRNWWGSDGAQLYIYSNGYIDASNPLLSDPWEGIPLRPTEEDNIKHAISIEGDPVNFEDIFTGIDLEANGNITSAVAHYKNMIRKTSHPKFALGRLAGIKKKFSLNDIQQYLETLLSSNASYKPAALNLIAGMYLDDDRYEEAMQLYDIIMNQYPESYDATNALFEKFFAALHVENNITLASQFFSELQSLNITDEDFLMRLDLAESVLNGTPSNGLLKGSIAESENDETNIPKEYALLGNYPNPFNPNTTISYALPHQSSVELIVYDIMGAKVKSFTIQSQPAGYQNILWDGRNENGNVVSSGVYIYRFNIKSLENQQTFIKSAKLMMLK